MSCLRSIDSRPPGRPVRLRSRRNGAAVVEAAICFPLIVILMMGTLEVCSGIYLKESVSICAFEGCRVGCRRGSTRDTVMERLIEVLQDRQISLPTQDGGEPEGVEIIPDDFSTLKALDTITVRITVPTQGNSRFIFSHLFNRSVTSQVTMIREFDD